MSLNTFSTMLPNIIAEYTMVRPEDLERRIIQLCAVDATLGTCSFWFSGYLLHHFQGLSPDLSIQARLFLCQWFRSSSFLICFCFLYFRVALLLSYLVLFGGVYFHPWLLSCGMPHAGAGIPRAQFRYPVYLIVFVSRAPDPDHVPCALFCECPMYLILSPFETCCFPCARLLMCSFLSVCLPLLIHHPFLPSVR